MNVECSKDRVSISLTPNEVPADEGMKIADVMQAYQAIHYVKFNLSASFPTRLDMKLDFAPNTPDRPQ